MRLLTESELQRIERVHADGITTGEIIGYFEAAEARLSEATFRKYVQLGLLPRCRRVGQKGKHKGSQGIYPVRTVRLINEIKRLTAGEATLEELAETVFALQGPIDSLEDAMGALIDAFGRLAEARVVDPGERKALEKDISRLQGEMDQLLLRVGALRGELEKAIEETPATEGRRTA